MSIQSPPSVRSSGPGIRRNIVVVLLVLGFVLAEDTLAAGTKSQAALSIGIPRYTNPQLLVNRMRPLTDYLNRTLDFPVEHEIGAVGEGFLHQLRNDRFDLAFVDACEGLKLVDEFGFQIVTHNTSPTTVLFTYKTSEVRRVQDLTGKVVSASLRGRDLAGSPAMQIFKRHEFDPALENTRFQYHERQEGVVLEVLGKRSDAGFVRESFYRTLAEALLDTLYVIAVSQISEDALLVATPTTSAEIIGSMRRALIGFSTQPEAPEYFRVFGLTGFEQTKPSNLTLIRKRCTATDTIIFPSTPAQSESSPARSGF
ncbi:MAG: PhnD/SsuA/transferrin family substrate-binding protein [Halieaceae bacterium]|nr:PhnD/SsuA/transferrin family substrate-binding protein [Halieaceae bacterium]